MALPTGLWQKHFGENSNGVVGITHPGFGSFFDELVEHDRKAIEEERQRKANAPAPCPYCGHTGPLVQQADEWPHCGNCNGV